MWPRSTQFVEHWRVQLGLVRMLEMHRIRREDREMVEGWVDTMYKVYWEAEKDNLCSQIVRYLVWLWQPGLLEFTARQPSNLFAAWSLSVGLFNIALSSLRVLGPEVRQLTWRLPRAACQAQGHRNGECPHCLPCRSSLLMQYCAVSGEWWCWCDVPTASVIGSHRHWF